MSSRLLSSGHARVFIFILLSFVCPVRGGGSVRGGGGGGGGGEGGGGGGGGEGGGDPSLSDIPLCELMCEVRSIASFYRRRPTTLVFRNTRRITRKRQ